MKTSTKIISGVSAIALATGIIMKSSQPEPLSFRITWNANPSGDYGWDTAENWSNVWFAVIRSPDIFKPKSKWQLMAVTKGTNYGEPRTNIQMFYALYNTNIVNGERSE